MATLRVHTLSSLSLKEPPIPSFPNEPKYDQGWVSYQKILLCPLRPQTDQEFTKRSMFFGIAQLIPKKEKKDIFQTITNITTVEERVRQGFPAHLAQVTFIKDLPPKKLEVVCSKPLPKIHPCKETHSRRGIPFPPMTFTGNRAPPWEKTAL